MSLQKQQKKWAKSGKGCVWVMLLLSNRKLLADVLNWTKESSYCSMEWMNGKKMKGRKADAVVEEG